MIWNAKSTHAKSDPPSDSLAVSVMCFLCNGQCDLSVYVSVYFVCQQMEKPQLKHETEKCRCNLLRLPPSHDFSCVVLREALRAGASSVTHNLHSSCPPFLGL